MRGNTKLGSCGYTGVQTGLGKLGDRSLLMLGGEKVSPAAGKEGDTPCVKEAAMLNRPGGPMNQRLDSSQRCVLAVAEPNDTVCSSGWRSGLQGQGACSSVGTRDITSGLPRTSQTEQALVLHDS